MAFDPCREWLGIDAVDLDKPHVVLGLAAGETDPVSVCRAAAARLAILNGLLPGPFVVARDALIQRIEEARDTLLAGLPAPVGAAALQSPATRAIPHAAMPRANSTATSFPGVSAVVPQPTATSAGTWQPTPPEPGGFAFETTASGPRGPAHHSHHHRQRPSRAAHSGLALAAIMFLLATSAGLGGYWFAARATPDRQIASRAADEPARRPTPKDPDRTPPARPRDDAPPRPRPRPVAEPDDSPPPQPAPSIPVPQEQPAAAPFDEAAAARGATAVDASLRTAFAAITGKDFTAAARTIRDARNHAGDDPDLHQRLDRWNMFNEYAREFVGHANNALKAANAGRDYPLGKTRIAVIESTPTLFVYKQAGEVKRMPRDKIPHDVLTAIVSAWFAADGRAGNHVFLGINQLAQPRPNVGAARREWQIAANGGEPMAAMMPLLDDPIITAAAAGR